MNKYLVIIGMMMLILIAGCTTQNPDTNNGGTTQNPITNPPSSECRTVPTEQPYVEEECTDITYTEEECQMKELNYTAGNMKVTDLCIEDGACVGKSVYTCLYDCQRSMKRCEMNITNNDETYAGTWVVGATYAYAAAAFVKNPQTVTIDPKETYTFDFEQMYDIGQPPTIAVCSLTVLYPAIVRECVQVEKTRTDCMNVTKARIVQQEVCD